MYSNHHIMFSHTNIIMAHSQGSENMYIMQRMNSFTIHQTKEGVKYNGLECLTIQENG